MCEPKQHGRIEAREDELNEKDLLAPADAYDPLIEAFKKDVDRTLLRENLKLTQEERSQKLRDFARFADALRRAGNEARAQDPTWGLK